MTLTAVLSLVGGLIVLTLGADFLVKGAARLALSIGVPSLVIGLTVVAYGTSTPELAVSAKAALGGQADISLGNVVGSNICNVWLILGLSAIVAPLSVHLQIIRLELPILLVVSFVSYFLAMDGVLSRFDGILLTAGLIVYTWTTVRRGLKEGNSSQVELNIDGEILSQKKKTSTYLEVVRVAFGLLLLIVGADYFVSGSVEIARFFGVSELVIGLTIVAVGTSMPELMTSVVASYRGERDIAVGNIIGSNMFNLIGVLGISASIFPVSVAQQALAFDIPIMILCSLMCMPFFVGSTLSRWRGFNFLLCYIAYIVYLVMQSKNHPSLTQYQEFLLLFFAPFLTAVIFVIIARSRAQSRIAKA